MATVLMRLSPVENAALVHGYDQGRISKKSANCSRSTRTGAGDGACNQNNTAKTPRQMLHEALAILRETQQKLFAAHSQAETHEQRRALKRALTAIAQIESDTRAIAVQAGRFLGLEDGW